MKRISTLLVASVAGLGLALTSPAALALVPMQPAAAVAMLPFTAAEDTITESDIIVGTMDITFNTRTNKDTSGDLKEGSAAIGAKDVYKFDIRVATTTNFAGEITRQSNLYTKNLGRKKQSAQLAFDVNLSVLNPKDLKQKRPVGKWVGLIPVDEASGAFDLAAGRAQERPLRIAIDTIGKQAGFTEPFGGRMVGKAEKKDNLAGYTFKRIIGDRTVEIKVKASDPMRFENIKLAKGPAEIYPNTIVSGRLDYDYETGNWYTDGIRFKYSIDGKDIEDVVTGSIKWVEEPDRAANGKGHYDFNLRFNEDKNKTATTEAAAFEKMSAEDAFFAVDDSVPAMTGKISYIDSFGGDGTTVVSSKVNYNLNANKLTRQQVVNFFKLWMICVGPTNDE